MNVLPIERQTAIISALVEGMSMRSISRMTGCHRSAISRLLLRVGRGSRALSNWKLQDLNFGVIQLDEIWCYVGKKQRYVSRAEKAVAGDFWTWVALDTDTKLVPTHRVAKRTRKDAIAFVGDLAQRVKNRVQVNADGLEVYIEAVSLAFGAYDVDMAQIVKSYEAEPIGSGRYSPPRVSDCKKKIIFGSPDEMRMTTSHVERQNLTMRMSMRRFTRLTNAFSKRLEYLQAAVDLHFGYYNFCRKHQTLGTTPAIAAGAETSIWTIPELIEFADVAGN